MIYKISVIIPIYNVEQYIEPCLQSVVNQTMTDGVECILVDDCGNDNSVTIAENFIKDYHGTIHFVLIHHEKNGGLSVARNTGIRKAKGNYLFFLDSDDEITPDCLKDLYSFIEQYGSIDLVQGSYLTNRSFNSSFFQGVFTKDFFVIKKSLLQYSGNVVAAQNRLVRRNLILDYNLFFKEGIIHEDNYWTFFLAKHIVSMAFCPKGTYYHRYNPTSITGNVNISKEITAYRIIITDFCSNIDSYLPGWQKELILNTLLTALDSHYYENDQEKDRLINTFASQNSMIEKMLLHLFLGVSNKYLKTKILHILIRIYKLKD